MDKAILAKAKTILLKLIIWTAVSFVGLFLILFIILQFPSVQRFITNKAVTFVAQKTQTEVGLGAIKLAFPKSIWLQEIYVEDQNTDTLLYCHSLKVDVDMLALLQHKIEINQVSIENLKANVYKSLPDSVSNYDFIIEAFQDTTKTEAPKSPENPWIFGIYGLQVENSKVRYNDEVAGMLADLDIGNLDVDVDVFDLDNMQIYFDDILLENTSGLYAQSKINKNDLDTIATSDSSASIDISFNEIQLSKIDFDYKDETAGLDAQIQIGKSVIEADAFDLKNKRIILDELSIQNTNIAYTQSGEVAPLDATSNTNPPAKSSSPNSTFMDFGWILEAQVIDLAGITLTYDNELEAPVSSGMDFNHIKASNFHADIKDVALDKKAIKVNIRDIGFKEIQGFDLNQLSANIEVDEQKAALSNLIIKTNHSSIQADLASQFQSLNMIKNNLAGIAFNSKITDTKIALQDVLFFNPQMLDSLPVNIDANSAILLNSQIHGKIGDFTIENLSIGLMDHTKFSTKGKVSGLPETNNLRLDLNSQLTSTSADLSSLLPDSLIKGKIQIPEKIEFGIDLKGSFAQLVTNLNLQTSGGSIVSNINFKNLKSSLPEYDGNVKIKQLNVGEILQDTAQLGIVDLEIKAQGKGFSMENMDNQIDLIVNEAEYKYYTYRDLTIDGQFKNQLLSLNTSIADENLTFDFEGEIGLGNAAKEIVFELNLEKAYLRELHLSNEDLRLKTKIETDLTIDTFKKINGDLSIREFAVYKNGELYRVDSFLVASVNEERNTSLKIDSDILSAQFNGTISILDLASTLKQHFSYYYASDTIANETVEEQNFDFEIKIKATDLLTEVLLPELEEIVPGEIKGEFNSSEKKLDVIIDVPLIKYGNFNLDGLLVEVKSDNKNLTYDVGIAAIKDEVFSINHLSLTGEVEDNQISAKLSLQDSVQTDKYQMDGTLTSENGTYKFHFISNNILLNYEEWDLPEDHFLQFGQDGITAGNISLTNGQQKIAFDSGDKNLKIDFSKFELATLSALVEGNKQIVRGMLDGTVQLTKTMDFTGISADLKMANFSYMEDTVGDIDLNLKNEQQGQYKALVNLSGNGNDVQIGAFYATGDAQPEMKIDADIKQLHLASIESLTGNNIQQAEGDITGQVSISGTPDQPDIHGDIEFNNTTFEVGYLGTRLSIDGQTIGIANNKVAFNNFIVTDVEKHQFSMDGSVDIKNMSNPNVEMSISSDNFLALNTTEEDNKLYFGKLILNSEAQIKGSIKELDISMKIDVGEGSDLTYVVPKPQDGAIEKEGILRFVDRDEEDGKQDIFFKELKDDIAPDDTLKAALGMNLNAIINIDKTSKFNIIVDPVAGDNLAISGDANLSLGINPAGDISLTGQYEVHEGKYNLSFYSIVKREFDVKEGSKLTWYGDVLNANIDLTALYQIETAPLDLMQSTASQNAESNIYKQKLPFIVILNMEGELLSPDISFELDMDDQAKSYAGGAVYGKIRSVNQDESEVNKQVFALLILKRFMVNNPFSSAGGSTEGTVRTSVSRLLSDQLNRLTDQIAGVDLNVDLKSYEDYSSGDKQGRTDLNLGLATKLFDDRVTVKVASNIHLEGAEKQQNSLTDFAGDVSVEYKLTEDGRFRLVTFRKEVYEALLQGEIIETGAGFIVVKDFDKFREIFQKNKSTNKNNKDGKE